MKKKEWPAHPIPAYNRAINEYRVVGGDLPIALDFAQRHYGTNPEVCLPHRGKTLEAIKKGGTIVVFEHTGVYTDALDSLSGIGCVLEIAEPRPPTKVILDARVVNILDPKRRLQGHTIEVAGVSRFGTAAPSENISVLKQAAISLKHGENVVFAPDGAKKHWDIGLWALMKLVKESLLIFAFTKNTTNLNVLSYVPLFGRFVYTPLFARKGQITFSEPVSNQEIMKRGDRKEITGLMETAMHEWGKKLESNPQAFFVDSLERV